MRCVIRSGMDEVEGYWKYCKERQRRHIKLPWSPSFDSGLSVIQERGGRARWKRDAGDWKEGKTGSWLRKDCKMNVAVI